MPSVNQDFYKLSEVAESFMEHPRTAAAPEMREGWRTIWRIRDYPSFEPMVAWDVALKNDDATIASVCELTWDRPSDAKRFFDPLYGLAHELKLKPTPSLLMRYATTKAQALASLVNAIQFGDFDPEQEKRLFLDGNHSYIEVIQPNGNFLRFHWENSTPPSSYAALVQWKEMAIKVVTELLAPHDAHRV